MRVVLCATAVTVACLMMGCSKNSTRDVATEQLQAVAPAAAPMPLHPVLAQAIACVTKCKTLYEVKPETAVPEDIELPKDFAGLMSDAGIRQKFEVAVKGLPGTLHDHLTAKPEVNAAGSLFYVIQEGDRRTYVYRMVGFGQFATEGFADADIAVDVATHDVAVLMRPTKDLDEYYLGGPQTLQAVLLLETSINDVRRGQEDLQLAYDRNAQLDYSGDHLHLPFAGDRANSVIARLTYLNTKYKDGQLLGVEATAENVEAKTVREANAWYVADINFTSCHSAMSPADRIKELQEAGYPVRTKDTSSSSGQLEVEVAYDTGRGDERFYRYFKSKTDCEAALPRNQAIPDRYR